VRLLKKHIRAALQRYLTFMQAPQLLREHLVQSTDGLRSSVLGRRIHDSTRTLREKWFGASNAGG
jgi:hypothetical protein